MVSMEESLAYICRLFSINILYSYGSRSIEVKEFLAGKRDVLDDSESDLDIGAKLIPQVHITIKEKVRLTEELEVLFRHNRVDLAFFHEVDPFVAANIVRGERLYCRDTVKADEFDLYILRRAGDLISLEREREALILGEE